MEICDAKKISRRDLIESSDFRIQSELIEIPYFLLKCAETHFAVPLILSINGISMSVVI